jgi:hypothetical protein
VHRPDLHDGLLLLGLEDAIATAPGHLGHVQKLGAVDHVVIWSEMVRRDNNIRLCNVSQTP